MKPLTPSSTTSGTEPDRNAITGVPEVDDQKKRDFLAVAIALLFPIDWPEPFGFVMIRSHGVRTSDPNLLAIYQWLTLL